jgi:hypothetical protein
MKKIFYILAVLLYCTAANAAATSFEPLPIETSIGDDKKAQKQRDKAREKKNKEIAKRRKKAQNKKPRSACKYKG